MNKTLRVAITLLIAYFAATGTVETCVAANLQVTSNSEAPQIPWLLIAAVIAAPFLVGLTLGAIIRKRRGLSFF